MNFSIRREPTEWYLFNAHFMQQHGPHSDQDQDPQSDKSDMMGQNAIIKDTPRNFHLLLNEDHRPVHKPTSSHLISGYSCRGPIITLSSHPFDRRFSIATLMSSCSCPCRRWFIIRYNFHSECIQQPVQGARLPFSLPLRHVFDHNHL